MKTYFFKYSLMITILFVQVLIALTAMGQSPQIMSYQAVIRNSSNQLVTDAPIGMKISILQGSMTGTAIYAETHTAQTNANGLVTIEIGNGTPVSGVFSTINWANGPYFVKNETDPLGGTNYTLTGVSQLMSVPYALFAEKCSTSSSHYIGELYGGGVVFHVYKDNNGNEHGLIVSLNDLSSGAEWGLNGTDVPNCESIWNGAANTSSIISAGGLANDAAGLCNASCSGGQTDWYLPSIQELNLLWINLFDVNKTLNATSGAQEIEANHYWSSTETDANYAWYIGFGYGTINNSQSKLSSYYVRGVRAY
ncbi:MAG: DUF1566 domain-containing protein [Bacteroidia bacterium]|nr:DUF1566 domain-containing protein [Bacteroidia bacterium]